MIEWDVLLIISGISFALGTILHEFGHKLFCNLTGVKVIGVSYLNFDQDLEADGMVIHKPPTKFIQALLITIGPLIIVGLVAIILTFLLTPENIAENNLSFFLVFGLFMSMFPSTHDVNNLITFIKKNYSKNFKAFVFLPFVYLLKVSSYFWVKIILVIILLVIISL